MASEQVKSLRLPEEQKNRERYLKMPPTIKKINQQLKRLTWIIANQK